MPAVVSQPEGDGATSEPQLSRQQPVSGDLCGVASPATSPFSAQYSASVLAAGSEQYVAEQNADRAVSAVAEQDQLLHLLDEGVGWFQRMGS